MRCSMFLGQRGYIRNTLDEKGILHRDRVRRKEQPIPFFGDDELVTRCLVWNGSQPCSNTL